MSALLDRARRGPALVQLAALLGRGVPLDLGLGALREELPVKARPALEGAVARAREGASLGTTLEAAGLVDGRDRAVLEGATGEQGPRALALLGDEVVSREAAARSLHLVFTRPVWKVALLVVFAAVVALSQILPTAYADVNGPRDIELLSRGGGFPEDQIDSTQSLMLLRPVGRAITEAAAVLGALAVLVLGVRLIARARVGRWFLERLGRRLPISATFLDLDTRGTFLRAFGTALGSGQPLESALERGRQALGDRYAATEIAPALSLARDGAPVEACLRRVAFLDETTDWLVSAAAQRPDLAREVLTLARQCDERLLEEIGRWAPLLGNLPELAVATSLGVTLVRTFAFMRVFGGL